MAKMTIELSPSGDFAVTDGNYSIRLPPTAAGALVLRDILLARDMGEVKLGQVGAPTQAHIEELIAAALKTMNSRKVPYAEIYSEITVEL